MSRTRLLVLDDDAAVGQTIVTIAEQAGAEARCVSAPSQFLAEVERWQPTHVAIDLIMPEMDGVEVLRLLAERRCRVRVIISSGVGSRILDAARRAAAEHGLDIVGVLTKPFLPATLRAYLSEAVRDSPRSARATAPVDAEVTAADLSLALDRRELDVAYQPKVRCSDLRLAGFEALARWTRADGGTVPPDRFIPLAESNGLIDKLTLQVFDRALGWLSATFPTSALTLSLNVSAHSLSDFDLGDLIAALAGRHRIEAGRIVLELTESSTMRDPATSLALLTRLRMKGYELSIDDFGTGYSSMLQLVRLPFSEIKVDQSFVMTATTSAESRAVIHSIVALGRSLGLRVVAEGVEDAPTMEVLREVGCDLAQGYLISRPLSGGAVSGWFGQWQKDHG